MDTKEILETLTSILRELHRLDIEGRERDAKIVAIQTKLEDIAITLEWLESYTLSDHST